MIRIALVSLILMAPSPARSEYRVASIPSFCLVGDRWEIAADNGGEPWLIWVHPMAWWPTKRSWVVFD